MIKIFKYRFLCLFVLITISGVRTLVVSEELTTNPLCGPQSLLKICELMGISANLNELCDLAGYDEITGTTMFGLYQAAIKKGLPAVPVKIDIGQLCSCKEPSIAYVDGNHFILVRGCSGDNVLLQNPSKPPFIQSKEKFKTRWNGETLVFSESLKQETESQIKRNQLDGPRIHFVKKENSFGSVNEGDKLIYNFKFTNIGNDVLKVRARSTCTCTAALLTKNQVSPGENGEINIEYNTSGQKGLIKEIVYVQTNDPDNQLMQLTISATVISSQKVVPDRLWLGEIAPGKEITREILVVDSGNNTLEIESIETPNGITAKILPKRTENLLSIPILLTINSGIEPVLLTINSGIEPGKFEKNIKIKTNNSRRSEIDVPISGTVLAKIKAFPPAFFFGEIKPDTTVVQVVTISTTDGERIEIKETASVSPYVLTEIEPNDDGLSCKIKAVLHTSQGGTTIREKIPIYISGKEGPALEIPLYAKVLHN